MPPSVWNLTEHYLKNDWSPEQLSGWMRRALDISVNHERIYQYIYEDKENGWLLHTHLRCQKKKRKRYGSNDRRGQLKKIDEV